MILWLFYDDIGFDSLEQFGYLFEQNVLFDCMMCMFYGINILFGFIGLGKLMILKVIMEGFDKLYGGFKYILIIEDLLEYCICGEGINQILLVYDVIDLDVECQVWVVGIVNGMCLDLDYMMIGEVCDFFVVVVVFCGVMIGYGLWLILYINSVIGIVQCLKDLGVDFGLLFDLVLLIGLINQSLLFKFCFYCKVCF